MVKTVKANVDIADSLSAIMLLDCVNTAQMDTMLLISSATRVRLLIPEPIYI